MSKKETMHAMSGANVLLECLKKEGVKYIFGYPGGALIPIYDALYGVEGLEHILCRHEQGGSHMADAYSRSTGKVGVCMGDFGTRRDESRDGHRDGVHGFDPDGGDHRTGAPQFDWHRCVSGSRHHRHLPPDHQACDSGEGRQDIAGSSKKRFTSLVRAGRGRCWWTFRATFRPMCTKCGRRSIGLTKSGDGFAGLQPAGGTGIRTDRSVGRSDQRVRTTAVVRGRRLHYFGCVPRIARGGRTGRHSSDDHVDGAGRVPGQSSTLRSAWPACMVRRRATTRWINAI